MYGLETVGLIGRQHADLEMVRLKILRTVMSVTKMDGVKNEYMKRTADVEKRRVTRKKQKTTKQKVEHGTR